MVLPGVRCLLDFLGDDFCDVSVFYAQLGPILDHVRVSVYVAVGRFLASPWHLADTCFVV